MQDLLNQIAAGKPLDFDQTVEAFERIMSGEADPIQVGALLGMMQVQGLTVDQLAAAASVMRRKAQCVQPPDGLSIIDTCGTGGDAAHTFNISTAAALVAAGAGRPRNVAVAKHGNRSVTSRSGSSQVLEALGVKLTVPPEVLTRCLDEAGICFCFAPAHHPAMKHAMPIRQALGFRTIFNVLGPLTNPAGARGQVIGVFSANLTSLLAQTLRRLGSHEAIVVHGQLDDGSELDEISTCGPTHVSHLHADEVRSYELDPRQIGVQRACADDLRVDGPDQSAARIRSVLAGERGPARDIVCLNAAAALVVADLAIDLFEGLDQACDAIDSGAARAALETLVKVTNES